MMGMSFLITMGTNCADKPVVIVDREIENQPLALSATIIAHDKDVVETQPLIGPTNQRVLTGGYRDSVESTSDRRWDRDIQLVDDNGALKDGVGRFEQIGAKLKVSMRKKNARLAWCELCCAAPLACVCTPVILTCRFATDMFAWATCGLCLISCCPRTSDTTNSVVLDYESK